MNRVSVFVCSFILFLFGTSLALAAPCQTTRALRSGTAATTLTMHANIALAHLRAHHQRARRIGTHQSWLKQRLALGGKVKAASISALQQLAIVKKALFSQFGQRKALVIAELDLAVGTVDTWLARYQQCRKTWFPKGDDKQTIAKERQRIQKAMNKVSREMGTAMRNPVKARTMFPVYQRRLRVLQMQSIGLGVVNVRNSLLQTRQRLLQERKKAAALSL